jgi:argininosuccinate lyase
MSSSHRTPKPGELTATSSGTAQPGGGVFSEFTDRRIERFIETISFDRRLYRADIRASIAHAKMLRDTGILTNEEYQQIEAGLIEIRHQIEANEFTFNIEFEDIHIHIERALIAKIGDVGRKLHTARSRNDQSIAALRLWVREAVDRISNRLLDVQSALIERADADFGVVMPGHARLQRPQPILLSHVWLGHCEKYERDRQRLKDCRRRVNVLGPGAAAVVGTSLPIDQFKTAAYLGFDDVAANCLDASSDRDFVLETAFCLAQVALHVGTLTEGLIAASRSEYNFLHLPQSFCVGSSIMPHKFSPDVVELMRGKSARVLGNLQTLLVLTKGLSMANNRDLQEDMEPIFDSFDTTEAILALLVPLIAGTTPNRETIANRLDCNYLESTTLIEYLVAKEVPPRAAHGIVSRLVQLAMERNIPLAKLPLKDFREAYEGFDYNVFSMLGAKNAVAAVKSYGSTAPEQVRKQIDAWKEKFNKAYQE